MCAADCLVVEAPLSYQTPKTQLMPALLPIASALNKEGWFPMEPGSVFSSGFLSLAERKKAEQINLVTLNIYKQGMAVGSAATRGT